MDISNQVLFAVIVALAFSLFFANWRQSKSVSLRRFFWGDENFSSSDLAHLFLSTSFSVNGLLYQTWLGYSIGWAALWTQVVWCFGYIWMAKYSSKIAVLSSRGTLHGVLGSVFGRRAAIFAAWGSVIGFLTLIGWEVACAKGIAQIILPNSPGAIDFFAILLSIIAAAYTIRGGIKGSLSANKAQNVYAALMLISAAAVLGYLALKDGGKGLSTPSVAASHGKLISTLGWGGVITNFVFSLAWQFVDMSNWQSISASAKTESTTREGLWFGAISVFFFPGVIGTVAGVFLSGIPKLTSDNVISEALLQIAGFSPFLNMLVVAGFIAAMLSTLDGYFLSASQAIIWDLKDNRRVTALLGIHDDSKSESMKIQETQILGRVKALILLLALLGSGGMLFLQSWASLNVFSLVYVATVGQLSLLPAVLAALRENNSLNGALSIAVGLALGSATIIAGPFVGIDGILDWAGTITVVGATIALFVGRGSLRKAQVK